MARIVAACDRAFLVTFADRMEAAAARAVRRLSSSLVTLPPRGLVDLHPAYASLLVTFDPRRVDAKDLEAELVRRVEESADVPDREPRTVVVPVRYGGEDGPDLDEVARETGLPRDEVVRRHAGALYEVVFLGFTPGFPYLAGLPPELTTRRRGQPRRRVEAGSVAIAGVQAGIYPLPSPGGWNVLGRTGVLLFDATRTPEALLAPGDRVRFVAEDAP
jgi:KipI family sensor histidine kinase inhibitor